MAKSALNNLQNDFLEAFFKLENHFFLSGGAALVGFYFGYRTTHDLGLFTLENEIENGFRLVNEVAKELNASVESIQTSPDFRRLLVKREAGNILSLNEFRHEFAENAANDIFRQNRSAKCSAN